jgi:hypothetical protein
MSRTGLIATIVLFVLAAGAVWWWNTTFVRAPTQVWVPASGEARLRPFLAAERFATRMGLEAKELRSLPDLDGLAPRGSAAPARQPPIARPAAHGKAPFLGAGRRPLIVESEPRGVPDPLFDLLAVRRVETTFSAPDAGAVRRPHLRCRCTATCRSSRPPAACCCAARSARRCTSRPSRAAAASSRRSRRLGFARNARLGEGDNAEALWGLMKLTPRSSSPSTGSRCGCRCGDS